jgi:hypothetical protein
MRTECEVCGEYRICDEEDVCNDCRQDEVDLEDWLPEDEESEDSSDY